MRLKLGDKAIVFNENDISGNAINLASFVGKKVYLTFYRGASCPFCNLRVHELIEKMNHFNEKDLVVIGFFKSTKEEILEHAGKQNPPFAIIPDPHKKYYSAYGLEQSLFAKMKTMFRLRAMKKIFANKLIPEKMLKDDNTVPADFLIDENGIIQTAHYGKDFGDHLNFTIIDKWINN
ncbi:MAG: hypothetical protein CVU09_11195 [Bacteroidetes bacterium HGW-Bacteroidetes-4]|jgi:peroxiredoxin|nr:MAG: hypothetical protein CVU09_11195 [Bacteroidetes bacterium HGW-Bacteroidetes-4]